MQYSQINSLVTQCQFIGDGLIGLSEYKYKLLVQNVNFHKLFSSLFVSVTLVHTTKFFSYIHLYNVTKGRCLGIRTKLTIRTSHSDRRSGQTVLHSVRWSVLRTVLRGLGPLGCCLPGVLTAVLIARLIITSNPIIRLQQLSRINSGQHRPKLSHDALEYAHLNPVLPAIVSHRTCRPTPVT